MFTLYWEYMAGSIVAQAMLEEAGADYELSYVDMAAGAHQEPAYRARNPVSRVPALTLPDGTTIGETGAIVTVLGELLPDAGLVPAPNSPDRAAFLFWLNVMCTTGYTTIARWCHPYRYAYDARAVDEVRDKAAKDLDTFFDVMEDAIEGEGTVLASGFSALDFYLAMLTEWPADRARLFGTRPRLARLAQSMQTHPSYAAAMTRHRLPEKAA